MPRGKAKKQVRRQRQPKSVSSTTIEGSAPTLMGAESFSAFMDNMQSYKRRTTTMQDARSQVLLGLAEVLQVNAQAVMHLGDIANTAPNYSETQDIKTTPSK